MNLFSVVIVGLGTLYSSLLFAQAGKECTEDSTCGNYECIQNNCLQSGKVKVTLSWTSNTDLDLFIETPNGETLSGGEGGKPQVDGGKISFDECYSKQCEGDSRSDSHPHVEHALWSETILKGKYFVYVVNHDGAKVANYTIRIETPDGRVSFEYGTIAAKPKESSPWSIFYVNGGPDCKIDTDGDGLCDKWETEGIDIDNDGTIDLDLKALGANPNHKDIFVEIDWMKGHKPFPLGYVTKAFGDSRVKNPDGKTGINLHLMNSEEITVINGKTIPKILAIELDLIEKIKFGKDAKNCTDGWFGSKKDRESKNCRSILEAKKRAFHYALFGHSQPNGAVGMGELPGNDFIITHGGSDDNTQRSHNTTFFHELGHNLGLQHGGADSVLCKPNYLSMMNYTYADEADLSLNYSNKKLPDLNEAKLYEDAGVLGTSAWKWIIWQDNKKDLQYSTTAADAVDWNFDGKIQTEPVSVLISASEFESSCQHTTPTIIRSHDDWSNLLYNFRQSSDYDARYLGTKIKFQERTAAQNKAAKERLDTDKDGVNNYSDVCSSVSDPGQEDRDHDGVGDACDACPDEAAKGFQNGCPPDPRTENDPHQNPDHIASKDPDNHGNGTNSGTDDNNGNSSSNNKEKEKSSRSNGEAEDMISAKREGCQIGGVSQSTPFAFLLIAFFFGVQKKRKGFTK